MASSVNAAFSEFVSNVVDLAKSDVARARTSRDWLSSELGRLHERHRDFPLPYSERHIDYGSFARGTKTRPLDDIDHIHCLSATGATYVESGATVGVLVPAGSPLRPFCHDDSDFLNSRRLINKFVAHLAEIPQYHAAQLGRRGEAAVLDLSSYPWAFDIVPGFFTSPEDDGRSYYLIPDGSGFWKKTDPRIDRERARRVNAAHKGHALRLIRVLKLWNGRSTAPAMPAYLLECILLAGLESGAVSASEFVDISIPRALDAIGSAIMNPVPDPKRIQGDINTLSTADRIKVSVRAELDAKAAQEARAFEDAGDHRQAIRRWGDVFGDQFPSWG